MALGKPLRAICSPCVDQEVFQHAVAAAHHVRRALSGFVAAHCHGELRFCVDVLARPRRRSLFRFRLSPLVPVLLPLCSTRVQHSLVHALFLALRGRFWLRHTWKAFGRRIYLGFQSERVLRNSQLAAGCGFACGFAIAVETRHIASNISKRRWHG